jgi:hypothetical protein
MLTELDYPRKLTFGGYIKSVKTLEAAGGMAGEFGWSNETLWTENDGDAETLWGEDEDGYKKLGELHNMTAVDAVSLR